MKTITILVISLLFAISLFAQTPGINYQAVVRDADGLPMANQTVSLSIDILESDILLFTEVHEVVTDEFGLINTIIGSGVAKFGTLDNLIGKKDLSYTLTGTINGAETSLGEGKLGAVPYAYYGADEDADPENELQELQLEGTSLSLSNSAMEVDISAFTSPWLGDSTGYTLLLDSASLNTFSRNGDAPSVRVEVGESSPADLRVLAWILGSGDVYSRNMVDPSALKVQYEIGMKDGHALSESVKFNENDVKKKEGFTLASGLRSISTKKFSSQTGSFPLGENALANSEGPFFFNSNRFASTENEESGTFSSLSIRSPKPINLDNKAIANAKLDEVYQTEVVKNTLIQTLVTDECYIERYVHGNPDPTTTNNQIVHEEKYTKEGGTLILVNGVKWKSNKSADEITECDNIPEDGNYERKVKQDEGTRIIEGIDGSTSYFEVDGTNGTSSAGIVVFNNELDEPIAASAVSSTNAGILNTTGTGGNPPQVKTGNMTAFPNTQHFTEGGLELSLGVNSEFAGNISVYNDGLTNLNLGTLQGIPNSGSIVGYDEGAPKWYLYTQDGVSQLLIDMVQTTVLSPNDDEEMAYGVLAGPEQAAYERGTATLVDGEVFVSCADHFAGIADPNSMTVTVTPLSAESLGLAIVEKSAEGFMVKELYQGKGNYSFDYMVMCKRSDVDYKLKPEIPKADNSMKEISDQARTSYLKAKSAIK